MLGRILSVVGFLLAVFSQPVRAESVPLTAYGELPAIEEAAISPSGRHIAMVTTIAGKRQILVVDETMKPVAKIGAQDIKMRSLDWAGDEALLLVTSQTERLGYDFTTGKHEFYIGTIIPVDGTAPKVVFSGRQDIVNSISGNFGVRKVGDTWTGYFGGIVLRRVGLKQAGYVFDHGRPYLFAVDLLQNKAKEAAEPGSERVSRDWLVGEGGELVATLDVDVNTGDWGIDGPRVKNIAKGRQATGRVWLIGQTHDAKEIVYGVRDEATGDNLWYAVPLDGGASRPFLEDEDVTRLYFDKTTGRMQGYLRGGEKAGPVLFDAAQQQAATKIYAAFAKSHLRMIDWTPDMSKAIVQTSGSQDSGTWYLVDLKNFSAKAFAYERMALGADKVGQITTFPYKASDGLEMDGILTLPPGSTGKNLPLVVMPHGGPHTYDTASFDWWAQAYASRGYAVFQPNFRGSTNRGDSFRQAGYGEWGRKMQTDISDGVAALAAKGIVDPKRACIVGASYGGYAALAGVTLQQGLYRCAVAVAPVSDIRAMVNEDVYASGGNRLTKAALIESLGDLESYSERSPRRLAARADAPVPLIHGKDDTVVPYSHSSEMADRLRDAGKPVTLVPLPGEDHQLSRADTRQRMLEESVRFVEQHNPAN